MLTLNLSYELHQAWDGSFTYLTCGCKFMLHSAQCGLYKTHRIQSCRGFKGG